MMREIIKKVNVLIKEKANGVSIPHNELFDALWRENAETSKTLLVQLTIYWDALLKKSNEKESYFKDNLLELFEGIESEKKETISIAQLKKLDEENKNDPFSDPEFIVELVTLFLSPNYEIPRGNTTALQVHIKCMYFCYACILPYIDKMYPTVNMKLDSVFAQLAYAIGMCTAAMSLIGKERDAKRPAAEKKKENAETITNKIAELIVEIATEKDKKKRTKLYTQAMISGECSQRSIINRVNKYKESITAR